MSRRVRVFELGMMTGLVVPLTAGAAELPNAEEMWRVIQAQQKTIRKGTGCAWASTLSRSRSYLTHEVRTFHNVARSPLETFT